MTDQASNVLILPVVRIDRGPQPTCSRCDGLRCVTFDQLDRVEQKRSAALFGSVFPCPTCGYDAKVIPFGGRHG